MDKRWKPVLAYAFISAAVYGAGLVLRRLEGANPAALDKMVYYPLAAGCIGYLSAGIFAPHAGQSEYYRLFSWTYNGGIAVLLVIQLLTGIAGNYGKILTYLRMVSIAGWTLLAVGILVLVLAEKERVKGEIER